MSPRRTPNRRQSLMRRRANASGIVRCGQLLEQRRLLAGDIGVSLNGDHLTVLGDAEDNVFEVTVLGGNTVVRGLDGTTVNGASNDFIVATGTNTVSGNVLISTLNGDDTVLFSRNVRVAGLATVIGGAGDDTIGSTGSVFAATLYVHGSEGDDSISFANTQVDSAFFIRTHSGDDTINLDSVTANSKLTIKSGGGDDNVVFDGITVEGRTKIATTQGSDDVAIENSTFNGVFRVKTRMDDDFIMMDNNTLNAPGRINMGRNDDVLLLRAGNVFNAPFSSTGGDDNGRLFGNGTRDTGEIAAGNTFNSASHFVRYESDTVSPLFDVNGRLDDTTTGALGLAQAAEDRLSALLVTDSQDLAITNDTATTSNASGNTVIESTNGLLVTRESTYTFEGTATPRSVINVDTDGDGLFDEGSTTADDDGNFTITVTLIGAETRRAGAADPNATTTADLTNVSFEATDEANGVQTVTTQVYVAEGSVARLQSNEGTIDIELFDTDAPITVANFKNYFDRYTGSVIHRSVPNFVIQGGGFTSTGGVVDNVDTDAPIQNEFSAENLNVRGTLSMALPANSPNGGTSQWFVNLVDNPSLDGGSGLHTVFGRVIGEGMDVVDAIAAIATENLTNPTGVGALTDTPFRNPFDEFGLQIDGVVTTTSGSAVVTGTGTRFTEQLVGSSQNPGGSRSQVQINGETFNVLSVESDTSMTLEAAPTFSVNNVTLNTTEFTDDDFVRFFSIGEVLN